MKWMPIQNEMIPGDRYRGTAEAEHGRAGPDQDISVDGMMAPARRRSNSESKWIAMTSLSQQCGLLLHTLPVHVRGIATWHSAGMKNVI